MNYNDHPTQKTIHDTLAARAAYEAAQQVQLRLFDVEPYIDRKTILDRLTQVSETLPGGYR